MTNFEIYQFQELQWRHKHRNDITNISICHNVQTRPTTVVSFLGVLLVVNIDNAQRLFIHIYLPLSITRQSFIQVSELWMWQYASGALKMVSHTGQMTGGVTSRILRWYLVPCWYVLAPLLITVSAWTWLRHRCQYYCFWTGNIAFFPLVPLSRFLDKMSHFFKLKKLTVKSIYLLHTRPF